LGEFAALNRPEIGHFRRERQHLRFGQHVFFYRLDKINFHFE